MIVIGKGKGKIFFILITGFSGHYISLYTCYICMTADCFIVINKFFMIEKMSESPEDKTRTMT
jgi:hypothetical protein